MAECGGYSDPRLQLPSPGRRERDRLSATGAWHRAAADDLHSVAVLATSRDIFSPFAERAGTLAMLAGQRGHEPGVARFPVGTVNCLTFGRRKYVSPVSSARRGQRHSNARRDRYRHRVAIGLIWSVTVMPSGSPWPARMKSAALVRPTRLIGAELLPPAPLVASLLSTIRFPGNGIAPRRDRAPRPRSSSPTRLIGAEASTTGAFTSGPAHIRAILHPSSIYVGERRFLGRDKVRPKSHSGQNGLRGEPKRAAKARRFAGLLSRLQEVSRFGECVVAREKWHGFVFIKTVCRTAPSARRVL